MNDHARVLDTFHKRLTASITQSSLLRVRVTRQGRLLDCSRLGVVQEKLPRQLLEAVVKARKQPLPINLQLRAARNSRTAVPAGAAAGAPAAPPDSRLEEHRALYDLLDRRMRRHAELAKRETGVHALWLGYPLLYAAGNEPDESGWVLAPVFLWPVKIMLDLRTEGRILVAPAPDAGPVQFNQVMATWVRRQLKFELPNPDPADLLDLDWERLHSCLGEIANRFNPPLDLDADLDLERVPGGSALRPDEGARLVHAAVLGYFRWPNEAILADLETLKERGPGDGVLARFLADGRTAAAAELTPPPEEDRYFVAQADFSQERAVWMARSAAGLVIHGPPGTGKSQTIVNIIADALAHERSVLMVCQKQAATRVVLERLRAAGLADLCLEVHNPESDRRGVFEAVRAQVEALPVKMPAVSGERRAMLARQITALEHELDRHVRALHEPHPLVGLAYRQMKALEGQVFTAFPTVRDLPALCAVVERLSWQQLEDLRGRIDEIGVRFQQADPFRNPWRHRRPTVQPSTALRGDVLALVQNLTPLDTAHGDHVQRHGAGQPLPADLAGFATVAPQALQHVRTLFGDRASATKARVARCWLKALRGAADAVIAQHVERCRQAEAVAQQVTATSLHHVWQAVCDTLPETELPILHARLQEVLAWQKRWWRIFSLGFHKVRRAVAPVLAQLSGNDDFWTRARGLEAHLHARAVRRQLRRLNEMLVPDLRFQHDDEHVQTQYPRVAHGVLDHVAWLCRQERTHAWLPGLLDACLSADSAALAALLGEVERGVARVSLARPLLQALQPLETHLTPEGLQEPRDLVMRGEPIRPWLDALVRGLDGLPALLVLDAGRPHRQGAERDVVAVLEDYEARRARGEQLPAPHASLPAASYGQWWLAVVRFTAARVWLARSQREQPVLLEVTPELHAERVRQLRDLLEQKQRLEAETIRLRWLARQVPHRNLTYWRRTLKIRSGRRGEARRLREAVEASLASGLLALRPCWLVNPAAASQLFPLQAGLFDLVIFDEASQCPLEQALPAVYRGKSLVVSGDEKQLPPTGFFAATLDEEEADSADGESGESGAEGETPAVRRSVPDAPPAAVATAEDLLQASVGVLPECYLKVHYRSEHPALIQFSNVAFYSGQLEAPPSRRHLHGGYRPIVYHAVGGRYDRRTNPDEADKVVELLRDLWLQQPDSPTVGVVTFNQPQRDLIEDRIEEECQRDGAFASRYTQERLRKEANQDVGFFVKNLENVQGDERDVMLFSTTFGPDAAGNFVRRFGPLGALGGERRLNVAVTRARTQVLIAGSMPIDRVASALIPGGDAAWTPAAYLQLYLAYAEAVSAGDLARAQGLLDLLPRAAAAPPATVANPSSTLAREVYELLVELGYQVDCAVGEGGFRLDLAVRHRDPQRGYVLGIDCDGGAFHRDRSARTHEVWRQELLARLGWRLHRIWSTQWWDHRDREVQRLRLAVMQATQT
jgi:primosomal replication protein N''